VLADTGAITTLLARLRGGEEVALTAVLPLVYNELRRIAAGQMSMQPRDHTLQATALVNEAVAKLIRSPGAGWKDRGHFLNVAASAMKQVLIDHARAKSRRKRSGCGDRIELDDAIGRLAGRVEERIGDVEALGAALERLNQVDPVAARIVELRFFLELTMVQAAAVMDIPLRSAEREWSAARAWLSQEIRDAR